MFKFRLTIIKKLGLALIILVFIMSIGAIGYMAIEDYTFVDAFYMTVITVSTVGFSEVQPLSENGKIFTSFLILSSLGTFAYAITSISDFIVSGQYRKSLKEYKMQKNIDELSQHAIICGYGRVGKQAITELQAYNFSFSIIEKNDGFHDEFIKANYLGIFADSTNDETLIKAGIKRAKALITTLPSDADNLFVVLSARAINPSIKIISRASRISSIKKLKIAGADNVIMPDSIGGAYMASLVISPDVMEFLERISINGDSNITLQEIFINHIPADFKGKTLDDIKHELLDECNIIGIKNKKGEYQINYSLDNLLEEKTYLFVLSEVQTAQKVGKIFA